MKTKSNMTVKDKPKELDLKIWNIIYELCERHFGHLEEYIPSLSKLVAEYGSDEISKLLTQQRTELENKFKLKDTKQ